MGRGRPRTRSGLMLDLNDLVIPVTGDKKVADLEGGSVHYLARAAARSRFGFGAHASPFTFEVLHFMQYHSGLPLFGNFEVIMGLSQQIGGRSTAPVA